MLIEHAPDDPIMHRTMRIKRSTPPPPPPPRPRSHTHTPAQSMLTRLHVLEVVLQSLDILPGVLQVVSHPLALLPSPTPCTVYRIPHLQSIRAQLRTSNQMQEIKFVR